MLWPTDTPWDSGKHLAACSKQHKTLVLLETEDKQYAQGVKVHQLVCQTVKTDRADWFYNIFFFTFSTLKGWALKSCLQFTDL